MQTNSPSNDALYESRLAGLRLHRRGKVRDLYLLDEEHLLILATDRISAFDVVLPDPVPGKGAILTRLSKFWFRRTASVIGNHLAEFPLRTLLAEDAERRLVEERGTVARRLRPLPIEAIVRGYLAGSGWQEYQRDGTVCGIPLPPGLRHAERLPQPIYTPSTKAPVGGKDENISFQESIERIGLDLADGSPQSGSREEAARAGKILAEKVRETSLRLYSEAAEYALERGIVIADTKFEFGIDAAGELFLIDEALTPDSSRFWPVERYVPGENPVSFDKQFVRDHLDSVGWDRRPPAPSLPPEIIRATAARYDEAWERLAGADTDSGSNLGANPGE